MEDILYFGKVVFFVVVLKYCFSVDLSQDNILKECLDDL